MGLGEHVVRDGIAAAKPRRGGCPADSTTTDYAFSKNPLPALSDSGAHGTGDRGGGANVDTKGNVTGDEVVGNTTGDDALAFLTEREIRDAKFIAPVRNCAAKAFIFTYKRSF